MFDVFAGDLSQVDLAALAEQSTTVDSILEESERAVNEMFGIEKPQQPSALLTPELPEEERPLYCILPVVMMVLEPLWRSEHWSDAQVESARNAAKITGRIRGSPTVAFVPGDDAANRASLEQLVRWFRATTAKPECLAAMIFTMDNGPYAGLAYDATEPLPALDQLALGEQGELRLVETEREGEPWVMQCVRDGKLQWSRVISGLPDGAVESVEFYEEAEAEPLGPYGWHVPFHVSWPAGEEQAHMYIDARGELLFYFLSW